MRLSGPDAALQHANPIWVDRTRETEKPVSRARLRVTGGHPVGQPPTPPSSGGPRGPGMRVLQEEAQHLACGVGPAPVGVGAGRAAAEPGVPGTVQDPLLDHRPPGAFRAQRAALGMAAGNAALLDVLADRRDLGRLRDDCVGVAGVHRAVTGQVPARYAAAPSTALNAPEWNPVASGVQPDPPDGILERMTTYKVVPRADGAGYDIQIVADNGARRTRLGFKTEAEAEAWIAEDKRLNHETNREVSS